MTILSLPQKLEQKIYIVAHLDFLGSTEKMINAEERDLFLQKIYKIYYGMIRAMEDAPAHGKPKLDIRIFSDNILFVHRVTSEHILFEEWQYVARWAATFQAFALQHELLVRGAITLGEFYIDETFVYGEALAKAYQMETHRAIYSRIIVDENFFRDTKFTGKTGFVKDRTFKRDIDGEWFVDFIAPVILSDNPKDTEKNYINIRSAIINLFHKHKNNLNLKSKYYWLVQKYNELIEPRDYFKKHKITFDINNEPDIMALYKDIE